MSVQLISRNGTLFSIIDGKEVQCKDQEQARFAIAGKYLFKEGKFIQDEIIYSVPGYTVRVEHMCESDCCTMNGNCEHCQSPILLAVLSLEAPEKKEYCQCETFCKKIDNCKLLKPISLAEQPAQPVDKTKEKIIKYLKVEHPEHDMVMLTNSRGDTIKFNSESAIDFFSYSLISPSPERGESEVKFTFKQVMEFVAADRVCHNIGIEECKTEFPKQFASMMKQLEKEPPKQ